MIGIVLTPTPFLHSFQVHKMYKKREQNVRYRCHTLHYVLQLFGCGSSCIYMIQDNLWHYCAPCTQRYLFWILLNQPEIRLYLPFSDWFGSKRTSVWIQINRKMVNTIWFRVDLTRCKKYFSVCVYKNTLLLFRRKEALALRNIFRASLARSYFLSEIRSQWQFSFLFQLEKYFLSRKKMETLSNIHVFIVSVNTSSGDPTKYLYRATA